MSFASVTATVIEDVDYDDNWSEQNNEDDQCVPANFDFEFMMNDEEYEELSVSLNFLNSKHLSSV